MDTTTLKKTRWFWPWQDEEEEAWLGKMSHKGWHMKSVQLPCVYTFGVGEPLDYTYRLDYQPADRAKMPEYLQIFQDAGWEYIGEMSNWRYWRKLAAPGETPEIFTDRESKLRKYNRLLAYMGFFLTLLVVMGVSLFRDHPWTDSDGITLISAIYVGGMLLDAVVIPIYVVVVAQLVRRINELKKRIG
jgi:hypothetical protein